MIQQLTIPDADQAVSAWATVILPLALPAIYTYGIPDHLKEKVKPGIRAEVVFGKSKKYAGIIHSLQYYEPAFQTKPILNILDESPILHPHQLALWDWMAQYYLCTEGEVMAAALPAHFKLSSETILIYADEAGDDFSGLKDAEYLLAEALLLRKQLNMTEVQQILDARQVYPVVKSLLEKKICYSWEKLTEKYKAKKENFVQLHPRLNREEDLEALLNDWKGAPRQMELLLAFLYLEKTEPAVTQTALLKKAGASSAQLKALEEKEIICISKRQVNRIPVSAAVSSKPVELSLAQQQCLQEVNRTLQEKNVCLLHGVTGSGKTQIYIQLIEAYLQQGKQVLYLLPEIALTAQIIRRLENHFGGKIAVYHSKFNDQERIEIWNRLRTGDARMVIGARSALFLPFQNLGLLIVDEEHDASFKQQDPAPRYHARDAAVYYASLFQAKTILGSATPSLESYYNAQIGKYGLVTLSERYGGIQLPDIQTVNLRQVAMKGKIMLSPQLKEAIVQTLQENKQVILFQNRRGYNPYLICGACGHIPHCVHCDVSLTQHKFNNKLHCHYCGSVYPPVQECPACGSVQWMEKNFGTEKIEEELNTHFPDAKIARMDVDTVRGKKAHDTLISALEQRTIDILVGTQMVVKGLDFDHVALVGILDADALLSFADFRVQERSYQLMEQVSGRAGRKHARGKVMIQALNPAHPVIQWVQAHDYMAMYRTELASRFEFHYPPFTRLVRITLRHADKARVDEAAEWLVQSLRQDVQPYITGPATPVIGRIRNLYLAEIMLKLPKDGNRSVTFKQVMKNHLNLMFSDKRFRQVTVRLDVDPQ